jgi:hypothetical protein
MALPDWSPVLSPAGPTAPLDGRDGRAALDGRAAEGSRDVDRENSVLRELVTVYRHLSGLAMQDADLAGVVQLISERATATVAVVSQLMDVQTAASPGLPPEKAAALVREHVVHPRLGQVLRASRLSQRALRLPNVGGTPAIIVAPILVGDEVPSYLITLDPAEESFGEDMSAAGHRARRHDLRGHPRPRAGGRRGRPPGPRRPGRGPAARPRPGPADAARWAAHLGYDPGRDAQRGRHRLRAARRPGRPTPSRCASGSGSPSSTSSPPGRPTPSSRPASPRS